MHYMQMDTCKIMMHWQYTACIVYAIYALPTQALLMRPKTRDLDGPGGGPDQAGCRPSLRARTRSGSDRLGCVRGPGPGRCCGCVQVRPALRLSQTEPPRLSSGILVHPNSYMNS